MDTKTQSDFSSLIQLLAAQDSRISSIENRFQSKVDKLSSKVEYQEHSSCKNCLIKYETNTNLLKVIDKLAFQIIKMNNKLSAEVEKTLSSCQIMLNKPNDDYTYNNFTNDQEILTDHDAQSEWQPQDIPNKLSLNGSEQNSNLSNISSLCEDEDINAPEEEFIMNNVTKIEEKLGIDNSSELEPDTFSNEQMRSPNGNEPNTDICNSANDSFIVYDHARLEKLPKFTLDFFQDLENQNDPDEQTCSSTKTYGKKRKRNKIITNNKILMKTPKIIHSIDNLNIEQASKELDAQAVGESGYIKDRRTFKYQCIVKTCDFTSKAKTNVLGHLLSHNIHKSYGCIKCGHTTKLVRILKCHYIKKHNIRIQNSDIIFFKPNEDVPFVIKNILDTDSEFAIRQKYENAVLSQDLEKRNSAQENGVKVEPNIH